MKLFHGFMNLAYNIAFQLKKETINMSGNCEMEQDE